MSGYWFFWIGVVAAFRGQWFIFWLAFLGMLT